MAYDKNHNMVEDRRQLLSDYYAVPGHILDWLITIPRGDERKKACLSHKVDPHILRTMLEYTRYPMAMRIEQELNRCGLNVKDWNVLDFGCLVADYGIYFARHGASIVLYDKRRAYLDFALYRFRRENRTASAFQAPVEYSQLFKGIKFVIFGEVLEHLDNPLEPIESCIGAAVSIVFTSCYPFGDNSYFALPGHSLSAQRMQSACLALLREHFLELNLTGDARLWVR